LTKSELPLYNLKYEGKEKADELDCYVFSVSPKSTKGGRMYFKGKIWVDDRDLQVVSEPVLSQKIGHPRIIRQYR
jgi:outer membrane lipoprotein-sorting protein